MRWRAGLSLALAAAAGCSSLRVMPVEVVPMAPERAARLLAEPGVFIVDVSPADDHERGRLRGAVSIPRSQLWSRLGELPEDKNAPILVYDIEGARSLDAAYLIMDDGYNQVHELRGGLLAWRRAGYSVISSWATGAGL